MRICSVKNCNKKHKGLGYCSKHLYQIKIHNKILERTRFDLNEIIVTDEICWMKLYDRYGIELAETIFDLKYKHVIEQYKWHLHNYGYVEHVWMDNNKQRIMLLHAAIIELSGQTIQNGYEIDHKDCNPLNNLEINLRICTYAENAQNQKIRSNNTSGQTGVSWSKSVKKWLAQIMVNGRYKYLGYFDNIEDATKAYNAAAIKYHGEFANIQNKSITEDKNVRYCQNI